MTGIVLSSGISYNLDQESDFIFDCIKSKETMRDNWLNIETRRGIIHININQIVVIQPIQDKIDMNGSTKEKNEPPQTAEPKE